MLANKGSAIVMAEAEEQRRRRTIAKDAEKPADRTSLGLRDALFDEIDALRRGEGDTQRATAIARVAMTILYSVSIEYRLKRNGDLDGPAPKPLKLGRDSDA